ncbi:MAG: acetyl-CoA carboxylase biotin carboxyl carrier protein [Gammaproteobacteria bacterium]
MDLRKLKSILELFSAAGIAEMKISSGDEKIHLIRNAPPGAVAATTATPAATSPPMTANAATMPDDAAEVETGTVIASPMVGTFYRSPSPDRPPFVQVGQRIEKGQTICIIEAMKLMNEIPAVESGIVRSIAAENGQPVSYGDPLVILE